MNYNRSLNNQINTVHERALRVFYRDKKPTFEDFLEKDNSVIVHMENIQVLVTEMFFTWNNEKYFHHNGSNSF